MTDDNKKNYLDCVTRNLNNKKEEDVSNKTTWTVINKKTKKVNLSDSTKALRKKFEKDRYHKITGDMINRWNNYRDELNDLLGDLSIYINYKEEINNMVEEEIKIDKMIEERLKDSDEYDSDSDYEKNKNLIY